MVKTFPRNALSVGVSFSFEDQNYKEEKEIVRLFLFVCFFSVYVCVCTDARRGHEIFLQLELETGVSCLNTGSKHSQLLRHLSISEKKN